MKKVEEKIFEEKRNEIYNSISKCVKNSNAFQALWEKWTEKSDYSMIDAIIDSIGYQSLEESVFIAESMIKEGIYPERLLCKLIAVIKDNPYAIGNNVTSFKEFADEMICRHYTFSLDTLKMFAALLEYLFANGYRNLAKNISKIYDVMPKEFTTDEKYSIHRKLVKVYCYNGMNYTELSTMIDEIFDYCKASKQKFMYGEIYYYHAVLEILSGQRYSYNLPQYMEKACNYRYDLAYILKNHINIES